MTSGAEALSAPGFRTKVTMPESPYHPAQAGALPAMIYRQRLHRCRHEAARLERRHVLLGYLRLLWVLAAAVLAWYIFSRHALRPPWLLVPCVGFGITARLHARVLAATARCRRGVAWYEHGLARIEDRWQGLHPRISAIDTGGSLYAADLDLFGPGSLFELLCTTRTGLGEDTLAAWLLQAAPADEVRARQAAVADLRDRVTLRETLAGLNRPVPRFDADALARWGEAPLAAVPPFLRWLAPVLAALTVAAAVRWALGHSPVWLSAALLVNGTITFSLGRRLKPLFEQTEQAARPLRALAGLFAVMESESFTAERLRTAQACFSVGGRTASQAIQRLARRAGAAEQRANFFTRLLDFSLLYSVQLAWLVAQWHREHGAQLRSWFGAFGDLEALLALSAYHFEHPEDTFPELSGEPLFAAQALGHPLLPGDRCIRNDLALDRATRLLIVSGSNMSGKSTLLRATGVACVMAMAGAPVRAGRLRLGPLQVAASIQVQDSLQGGRSRFYAEILRLRAVCDLARTRPPVLFLLDELLAGTNSHDRLAGATGVVETLLRAGAIGLLSTHDLALTQLGTELQQAVRNAHFEDRIEGEGLQFDYTLRDGIITRSNGLELMRLIGLTV